MKILKIIFNGILYCISFFIPRSRRYVIVGGWQGKRYADNSRGIYEYLTKNKEKLGIRKIFWYTNSKEIYNRLSLEKKDVLYGLNLRSIYWHMRSKIHFIDQNTKDILGIFSVGAIRIDLWHGVPLKKIGNYIDGENSQNWKQKYYTTGCWSDKYLVATSKEIADILQYSMGVKKNKMLICSYPRNQKLYNCDNKYCEAEEMKVFYLPTFRDNKDINPVLKDDFLIEMDNVLRENNIKLYIKPHFSSISSWNTSEKLNNIFILNANEDVYDWLSISNVLITDYSSVYFDFLLTGRPIIFFPYDLYSYENVERGFIFPYDEFTPGDKVVTAKELLEKIIYLKENYKKYILDHIKQYKEILNRTNKYADKPNYDAILKFWKNTKI